MENSNVLNEIELWDNEFVKNSNVNDKIYEVAIFKIFVKLEKFLSEMFVIYSTGQASSSGYNAKRKLEFIDESHLKAIFRNKNKKYIDYDDKIINISKHIFEEKKNPFDLIFLDSNLNNCYLKMKLLRNYIAHESEESKNSYIKSVLDNKDFIEPYEYLMQINKKKSKSNYSIFIEKIIEITTILINPASYLGEDITPKDINFAEVASEENIINM